MIELCAINHLQKNQRSNQIIKYLTGVLFKNEYNSVRMNNFEYLFSSQLCGSLSQPVTATKGNKRRHERRLSRL